MAVNVNEKYRCKKKLNIPNSFIIIISLTREHWLDVNIFSEGLIICDIISIYLMVIL